MSIPVSSALAREWFDLCSLQQYADVSDRTLRGWIHRRENPLPAVQVGRKLLVKRSEFDRWLQQHRSSRPADMVGKIVENVMKELLG